MQTSSVCHQIIVVHEEGAATMLPRSRHVFGLTPFGQGGAQADKSQKFAPWPQLFAWMRQGRRPPHRRAAICWRAAARPPMLS